MGRMSRNKGARGERELAAKFEEIFGCKARRGRLFRGSPDSPDIQTTLPGVHPECKRVERFNVYDAMDQATADAGGKVPIVCHRRNKKDWILCMKLKDAPRFAQLISDFMNRKETGDENEN